MFSGRKNRTQISLRYHAGMVRQPTSQSVGLSRVQEVDGGVAFEVDEDHPVGVPASPLPLVNAEDTGRRALGLRRAKPAATPEVGGEVLGAAFP